MPTYLRITAVLAVLLLAQPVRGWFDGGHMVVAYIAYKSLTPRTRSRVDALLRLNPMYGKWTKHLAPSHRGLVAFLNASTWPDCIKQSSCAPGYTSDGGSIPSGNPTDAQNIGYSDTLMHKYWHFIDKPIEAGATGKPPKDPNVLTEIILLTAAIHTNEPRRIKSYDIAWLEHLVGDVHQTLHCTSRFTANHSDGDAGGNLLRFCASPCRDELHAYWDGLLGDKPSIAEISKTGDELLAESHIPVADDSTPQTWVDDSVRLARSNVYVPPISDDNDPTQAISPRPDPLYASAALKLARSQVTLAGYRLASLLNTSLK